MTTNAMQGRFWKGLELQPDSRDILARMLSNETDMMFRRRAFILFSYLGLKPEDVVLEAGCGRGFFLNMARALSPCCLTGVELDAEVLEEARRSLAHKEVELLSADIQQLPFSDAAFDKVLFTEVLEHIPDDKRALQEIFRVLRPGGTLALSVPNARYPFLWDPINWVLEATIGRPIRQGILSGIWANHERLYQVEELQEKVREAGFVVEEARLATYFCVPFAHNIVYGIGKELLVAGLLPKSLSTAADRFAYSENKGSLLNPINLARRVFLAVDRLNDDLPMSHSSVVITLKARKY